MRFEYDRAKSAANKAKHGIDFEEAQALWDDEDHIVVPSSYRAEARRTAIVTNRGGRARIISVRRARHDEAETYFSGRVR